MKDSRYLLGSELLSEVLEDGDTAVLYTTEPSKEERKRSASVGRALTPKPGQRSAKTLAAASDRLLTMSGEGAKKNLAAKNSEKNAEAIRSSREEEECGKRDFARQYYPPLHQSYDEAQPHCPSSLPLSFASSSAKTNIITKRKVEEKKKKEKAKIANKRKATLLHLLDGGWKGEFQLPGSYEKAASIIAIFHICGDYGEGSCLALPPDDALEEGDATYGYVELLPQGDLGGPNGMVVRWTARTPEEGGPLNATLEHGTSSASVRSSRSSAAKTSGGAGRGRSILCAPAGAGTSRHGRSRSPPPLWEIDLSFPPSLTGGADPIPAVLRYSSASALEVALPVSDSEYPPSRPESVAWPHAVMSLNLVPAEEVLPKSKKVMKRPHSLLPHGFYRLEYI